MRRLAPLLLMAACGDVASPAPTVRARTPSPGAHVDRVAVGVPIAKGVPHGGQIREIAATEEGDAAITVDELDAVRLWPALDGSRAPVPVSLSSPPSQLALFHDGRDLVAVTRDVAGSVSLVRLGLDGSVRGRVQVAGDASYEQIVAVGDQVLARTSDHAIELYDADGTLRGRAIAGHGQRVTDLAARNGRAVAIIATSDGASMRWLGIGTRLRWESAIRLPLTPRDGMFAIAPNKRRIAYVDNEVTGLHVLDVDMLPVIVPGPAITPHGLQHDVGFVDDDTVVVAGSPNMWWKKSAPPPPAPDPWAVAASGSLTSVGSGTASTAIVDGKVIGPYNVSLVIGDGKATRYLGWQSAPVSGFVAQGSHLVMNWGARITWLDENLALARTINLQENRQPTDPWRGGVAVGSHHVVTQKHVNGTFVIELLDVDKPDTPTLVGRFTAYDRHEVVDGMLAVFAGRTVRRFRLDLDATTATELLPALEVPVDQTSWLRLFDPEKSGELVAVAAGWDRNYLGVLYAFRQSGRKITRTRTRPFEMTYVTSDASGRVVVVDHTTTDLVVMRGAEIEHRIDMPPGVMPVAVDRAGTRFALRDQQELVLVDGAGKELWRKMIWGMSTFAFFANDKRLAVAAPGGFIALDVATGEQVARECGWGFGLHETAPESSGQGSATVCEDPIVP